MADYERNDSATDEIREKADDVGDAARRGAEETKEGAESIADRVSDAVEDVIPGDSDNDGHQARVLTVTCAALIGAAALGMALAFGRGGRHKGARPGQALRPHETPPPPLAVY